MGSGYVSCACRDCFDIAIASNSTKPALCVVCKLSGCNIDGCHDCECAETYLTEEDVYDRDNDAFDRANDR